MKCLSIYGNDVLVDPIIEKDWLLFGDNISTPTMTIFGKMNLLDKEELWNTTLVKVPFTSVDPELETLTNGPFYKGSTVWVKNRI